MKKIVVLTGAGVSAESGLKTFRDSGGLWEGHDVYEVATPEGWNKNPELVLEFYNQRRIQAAQANPNEAHKVLAELENDFDVIIITQNVDDLHERAGSTQVIHLHGELSKSRSSLDENLIYEINHNPIHLGDLCEKGSQLRPHIVWFGEPVHLIEVAADHVREADIVIVVGTSLVVYPAAGLVHLAPPDSHVFVIDPNLPEVSPRQNLFCFEESATTGMPKVKDVLLKN